MSHNADTNDDGADSDVGEPYETLRERAENMEKMLKEAQQENQDLRSRLERLEKENDALKSTPNYIGTVENVLDEKGKVILKKHGDNQEFLTDLPETVDVEPGVQVAINESMSITERVNESSTDARAHAMEVSYDPDVTYDDIGGLEEQLIEVRETVEDPIVNQDMFDNVGIKPPSGVLLHGQPGTGKTLMARAVANESNATFLKLAASELAQKFIGEGSRLVRNLFDFAEENAPAVIFIDEIDAIASRRTEAEGNGGAEVQRTLMQLLSEMDGFDNRGDVRVIGATNRFDTLDEAILRPGRFDRIIEVPAPDINGRRQIFEIYTQDMSLTDSVEHSTLAEQTDGFTGADIQATCTEAGMVAIRDDRSEVTQDDFMDAIHKVKVEDENPVKTLGFQ